MKIQRTCAGPTGICIIVHMSQAKHVKLSPNYGGHEKHHENSAVFCHNRNGDALAWARQAIERDIDAEQQHGKVRIIMANGQKGPDA